VSLLLNIRVLIALAVVAALGFSHFTVYRAGKNDVRKEWLAATAAANIEANRMERARQRGVDEALAAQSRRNAGLAGDIRTARANVDSLRGTLDATERMAASSHSAATLAVATYRNVFEQCVREYQALGEIADRHSSDAVTLRDAWPK
jgi:hypothetical protein